MKRFLCQNCWWIYFVLTFLISWPIWLIGRLLLPENLRIITLITGGFGPFLSALIMLNMTEEGAGLLNWLKSNFKFRINILLYLAGAIIIPFVIAGTHHAIYLLFGGKTGIDFSTDWLLIYCIPLSMILTWLYNMSKRSIIPVMLLHAGTNTVFRYFPMETKVFDTVADEFTLIKTIVYLLFAIVLLAITKGSLGNKRTASENMN